MGVLTMRIEALRNPPIAFAHRGAAVNEAPDSAAAYALAMRLGATGIESDLWLTRDGHPVLAATSRVRRGLRRFPIRDRDRDDLAEAVSDLQDLVDVADSGTHIHLTVRDPAAADAAVESLTLIGLGTRHLWLGSNQTAQLATWRTAWPDVGLVHSTRLAMLSAGPERHAAALSQAGISAVQMPYPDWTGGLTTLFHRFGIECFGWDAPHGRMLDELIRAGCDGISTIHIDRLVDALS